jgi:hypothetical protein
MRVYNSLLSWKISAVLAGLVTCVGSFFLKDSRPFLAASALVIGVLLSISEFITRVIVDDQAIHVRSIATLLARFLPYRRLSERMPWSEISRIQLTWNPFFIEANPLMIIPQNPKTVGILVVPIYDLQHRSDLLRDILTRVPPGITIDPAVSALSRQRYLTPPWQRVLLAILLLAVGGLFIFAVLHRP